MPSLDERPQAVRFGAFEMDLHAGELRKNGLKVKLQEQPFRVLSILVRRAPAVVVREVLYPVLSAHHAYDCKHALNNAIQKSREALGDSPDSGRFIETIPGRGYRFVAPVELIFRAINGTNETGSAADPFLLKIKEASQELLVRTSKPELLDLYYRVFGYIDQFPGHPDLCDGHTLRRKILAVLRPLQNVSERTLAHVFDDPGSLSMRAAGVNRWQTMGMVGSVVVVVDHTMREENGQEVIRITSGRKATRNERAEYERNLK
jgi:DNA-binding winged helix-turn-helix (wHTH) protein/uncharacterized DUF497 family protein